MVASAAAEDPTDAAPADDDTIEAVIDGDNPDCINNELFGGVDNGMERLEGGDNGVPGGSGSDDVPELRLFVGLLVENIELNNGEGCGGSGEVADDTCKPDLLLLLFVK